MGLIPGSGRSPGGRRAWQSTPVLLPTESHGQRTLVHYSPWGHKESDLTEQLITAQVALVVKNPSASAGDTGVGSLPGLGRCSGVGNGSSLQYSCLENSIDRGTW